MMGTFGSSMAGSMAGSMIGNTLFGGKHFLYADSEYEQAMRYLVFMPHPSEEEKARAGPARRPGPRRATANAPPAGRRRSHTPAHRPQRSRGSRGRSSRST